MGITITIDGNQVRISDRAILGVIAALEQYRQRKAAMKPDSVVKEHNTTNSVSQAKEVVTR